MINCNNYLISVMKRLSINIKQNRELNIQLHDLIPDEREASIESAKLIYDFSNQCNLLNTVECNEITNNLKFYLSNGYLYSKNISIFPYQSISRFEKTVPQLVDKEIDRMNAFRWLSTLSPENLNVALNMMNKEQLQFVADMIGAYQQANMENTHITKKICK